MSYHVVYKPVRSFCVWDLSRDKTFFNYSLGGLGTYFAKIGLGSIYWASQYENDPRWGVDIGYHFPSSTKLHNYIVKQMQWTKYWYWKPFSSHVTGTFMLYLSSSVPMASLTQLHWSHVTCLRAYNIISTQTNRTYYFTSINFLLFFASIWFCMQSTRLPEYPHTYKSSFRSFLGIALFSEWIIDRKIQTNYNVTSETY